MIKKYHETAARLLIPLPSVGSATTQTMSSPSADGKHKRSLTEVNNISSSNSSSSSSSSSKPPIKRPTGKRPLQLGGRSAAADTSPSKAIPNRDERDDEEARPDSPPKKSSQLTQLSDAERNRSSSTGTALTVLLLQWSKIFAEFVQQSHRTVIYDCHCHVN